MMAINELLTHNKQTGKWNKTTSPENVKKLYLKITANAYNQSGKWNGTTFTENANSVR